MPSRRTEEDRLPRTDAEHDVVEAQQQQVDDARREVAGTRDDEARGEPLDGVAHRAETGVLQVRVHRLVVLAEALGERAHVLEQGGAAGVEEDLEVAVAQQEAQEHEGVALVTLRQQKQRRQEIDPCRRGGRGRGKRETTL